MSTATEQTMAANSKARREHLLDQMMEQFVRKYMPDPLDPDTPSQAEFTRDLMSIVRLTYETAQTPFVREYHALHGMTLNIPDTGLEKGQVKP